MNRILALGSSQLVGFKRGVDSFDGANCFQAIDYAGMWETGFGYLELNCEGRIVAPDYVPRENNPSNVNLSRDWRIWNRQEHSVPLIHDYSLILIVASPCKYFAPIYYHEPQPIIYSASVLQGAMFSGVIDHQQFDYISPWQFRISPVISSLLTTCPSKIVFVGSPLPIYGQETEFIEPLRATIASNQHLQDIHMSNIAIIRTLSDKSLSSSTSLPYRIVLPPRDLCCEMFLSTREEYYKGNKNAWHADTSYWIRMIEELGQRGLVDL